MHRRVADGRAKGTRQSLGILDRGRPDPSSLSGTTSDRRRVGGAGHRACRVWELRSAADLGERPSLGWCQVMLRGQTHSARWQPGDRVLLAAVSDKLPRRPVTGILAPGRMIREHCRIESTTIHRGSNRWFGQDSWPLSFVAMAGA